MIQKSRPVVAMEESGYSRWRAVAWLLRLFLAAFWLASATQRLLPHLPPALWGETATAVESLVVVAQSGRAPSLLWLAEAVLSPRVLRWVFTLLELGLAAALLWDRAFAWAGLTGIFLLGMAALGSSHLWPPGPWVLSGVHVLALLTCARREAAYARDAAGRAPVALVLRLGLASVWLYEAVHAGFWPGFGLAALLSAGFLSWPAFAWGAYLSWQAHPAAFGGWSWAYYALTLGHALGYVAGGQASVDRLVWRWMERGQAVYR